jgi:large subunit ribosomal protein L24e
MVERRVCSFCGNEIEPGTGKIYIKVDGTIYNFCKNKCHKNMIQLKRVPRRTSWTQQYMREKSIKMSTKGKKVVKRKKVKSTKPTSKKVSKAKSKTAEENVDKKKGKS